MLPSLLWSYLLSALAHPFPDLQRTFHPPSASPHTPRRQLTWRPSSFSWNWKSRRSHRKDGDSSEEEEEEGCAAAAPAKQQCEDRVQGNQQWESPLHTLKDIASCSCSCMYWMG